MQTKRANWTARIALIVVVAMYAGLFGTLLPAAGQAGTPLVTMGVDLVSATTTQATYELLVTNQGSATATAVRVNSNVPANTTFESSVPSPVPPIATPPAPAACDNLNVRETAGTKCEWAIGDMVPGATATITATYNLNQADIASYTVSMIAQATQTAAQNNSNTDATLKRDRLAVRADTFVDDTATTNTNHGACNKLRVKKDNTTTSFIDFTGVGALANLDSFWGAQVRAIVEFTDFSSGAPGGVGLHRITPPTAPLWTEGTGTCAGTVPATPAAEARTGAEPSSAASPTSIAVITGAEQVVNWDVTADVDTPEERSSSQGWEMRDSGSAGSGTIIEFDSKESGTATQVPRLFLVYSIREAAACIDVDPETDTNNPTESHRMEAYVTDGALVGTREAESTDDDGCSGNPVEGAQVLWTIEDDAPDAWISNQNGTPTTKTIGGGGDAQPNAATTSTDAAGKTFIDMQLDEPSVTGQNSGDDRISGRIVGTPDVEETDEPAGCDDILTPCGVGEDVNEDDVIKIWDPAATVAPTVTTTPTPTGTPTPTTTPTGTPTGTPTATPSETPTPTPTVATRSISLFSDRTRSELGESASLSGVVLSSISSCKDNEFVLIRKRIKGSFQFEDVISTFTDAAGGYAVLVPTEESADYTAVAPGHDSCPTANSAEIEIIVPGEIRAKAVDDRVRIFDKGKIKGKVKPNHRGTKVVLKRKKGDRFVKVGAMSLNARSRFKFVFKVKWTGKRVFKVEWKGHVDHEAVTSDRVVIRGLKP